eukprot:2171841-Heterocapsa_arctica.AAC.1
MQHRWARKLLGIHPIPGRWQQGVCIDTDKVHRKPREQGAEGKQERRPSGVHTGRGIFIPVGKVRCAGRNHGPG